MFWILTIDYKCMYPSMPDDLVLSAVRDYLESRTDRSKPSTQKTMELLEITRKYNYFTFGEGKVSEDPFQNYSAAFTRASPCTLLRPIVHLIKITFCYQQTLPTLVDRG